MKVFVSEMVTAFILVILSDGVAAALAARKCWRLRKRAGLALPLAVFMGALAIVDLSDLVNVIVNGVRNPSGPGAIQALIGRALRSVATWYLALKLMNGYSRQHQEEEGNATTTPKEIDPGGPSPAGC